MITDLGFENLFAEITPYIITGVWTLIIIIMKTFENGIDASGHHTSDELQTFLLQRCQILIIFNLPP